MHCIQRWSMALVMVGGSLSACSNVEGGEAVSEEAAIRGELAKLGFHDQIDLYNDYVMVQGDIRFDRDGLLNGEYTAALNEQAGDVEKGYRQGLVSQSSVSNIRLVWDTSVPPPADNIAQGIEYAANEWTNPLYTSLGGGADDLRGKSAVNISFFNNGPEMLITPVDGIEFYNTLEMGVSPCGETVKPNSRVLACAHFPRGGQPGRIYVPTYLNPFDNPGTCNWTQGLLNGVLVHEMGHALGFAHPMDEEKDDMGNVVQTNIHIDGTAWESDQQPSIMRAYVPSFPGCQTDYWNLQYDDILSAASVYPN